MATLNKHTSVSAAILSDISDHSDRFYVYTVSEQMSTTNKKEYFKQNTKRNHNLLQTNTSHVT